ncbi:merozoite surface protein 7 (MSP7), putative [Plasmodium ovale wallikeri]|uniref:Merozoite surface protein 7 (MSP7), putative n=1 Tax=Plasmodium ovale wallikeri TaxID=864142 RepID=A0A1A9AMP7_PLAOA|nr:merozoite surface protein 7 (MSP7), putative [Plasmodium ovale wallikeri]
MRVKVVISSPFFFLFLLRYVTCKVTANNKQNNYSKEGFLNLLNKKLENLNNTVSGDVSANFNKDIELLKKEIEELQKYEKVYGAEDFDENLEDESGDGLGKKKKILGVDEDELDNYDGEFFGQGKSIIKGDEGPKADGDHTAGASGSDTTQGTLDAHSHEQTPPGSGTEHRPSEPGRTEPEANNRALQEQNRAATVDGETVAGLQSTGTLQTGPSPPEPTVKPEERTHTTSQEKDQASATLAPKGPVNEANADSPPAAQPQGPPALTKGAEIKKQTPDANATTSVVKYMDSLYDEIITESGQNEKAENTKKHSNYSNLKKKYNFPMNGKEYNMVKKLFGECFKKGDTTNASENATCQVDVLAKVLQDKAWFVQLC